MRIVKRQVVDYDWGDNRAYRFHVWVVPEFRNPPEEIHDPGLGGPLGGYLLSRHMSRAEAEAVAAASQAHTVVTENPHWIARRN